MVIPFDHPHAPHCLPRHLLTDPLYVLSSFHHYKFFLFLRFSHCSRKAVPLPYKKIIVFFTVLTFLVSIIPAYANVHTDPVISAVLYDSMFIIIKYTGYPESIRQTSAFITLIDLTSIDTHKTGFKPTTRLYSHNNRHLTWLSVWPFFWGQTNAYCIPCN